LPAHLSPIWGSPLGLSEFPKSQYNSLFFAAAINKEVRR